MRPKVVISIFVAAFGLLGLIALFKGTAGKNTGGGEPPAPVASETPSNPPVASNPPAVAGNQIAPVVSPELRAAIIQKETQRIQELQAEVNGTNNSTIIAALLQELDNPEAEVHATALRALKEMNDTNALPGLQQVADNTKDPREKVAILDAIDYIKLPDANANVPIELTTNTAYRDIADRVPSTNHLHARQYNPAFQNKAVPHLQYDPQQATTPQGNQADQPQ